MNPAVFKEARLSKFIPMNTHGAALAAKSFHNGEIVAFPTETVYGLAARADDPDALDRLYALKNRPDNKPLPLCLAHKHAAESYAEISQTARRLMDAFWPGPLTLVLPALNVFRLAPQVYGPGDTVALRRPNTPFIDMLSQLSFHLPLALTSANLSGEAEAHSAMQVNHVMGERVPLIIDGGMLAPARPSTIVKVDGDKLSILRQGDISEAALHAAALCRAAV